MSSEQHGLLFGLLAVQLKKVSAPRLAQTAGKWAENPSQDLGAMLVGAKVITDRDRAFIEDVRARAMKDHDGDAAAALASLGGPEEIRQVFRGSVTLSRSGEVQSGYTEGAGLDSAAEYLPAVQEIPGRYTYLKEHSHGGMGRILIVHDEHLGREIALKELLPRAGEYPEDEATTPVRLSMPVISRFLSEARITGQLEHPSIIPVYELGHRLDGTLYYTMKLVRGQTLTKALSSAKSLGERMALLPHFVNLCQAIAYAHDRGVIHRDIKPDNIMIGEFGETVVIDWGIAKTKKKQDASDDPLADTIRIMRTSGGAPSSKTEAGSIIGTPFYMPPEQAEGRLEWVDERSDIYALGAVLYEILTGRRLHEGKSVREVIERVIFEEPVPVRTRESRVPPELAAICEHAIRKNRLARYVTAKELADDVQRFMQGQLVHAYRYGVMDRTRRFIEKRQKTLTTAVSMLVLAYALLAFSNLFFLRQNVKLECAQLASATADAMLSAWMSGKPEAESKELQALTEKSRVIAACLFAADKTKSGAHARSAAYEAELPDKPPDVRYVFRPTSLLVSWQIAASGGAGGTLCLLYQIPELPLLDGAAKRGAWLLAIPAILVSIAIINQRRKYRFAMQQDLAQANAPAERRHGGRK